MAMIDFLVDFVGVYTNSSLPIESKRPPDASQSFFTAPGGRKR
jgi:hypothetical protein